MTIARGSVTMSSAGTDHLAAHPLVDGLTGLGQRLRRLDARRPWLFDAAVVAAVLLVFCAPDFVRHSDDRRDLQMLLYHPAPAGTLALQLGLVLPLFWRRRAPTAAFYTIAAVFVLQWSLGVLLRADVALVIAVYSLVLRVHPARLPWAGLTVAAALGLVAWRVSAVVSPWDALFFLYSAATAAAALGFAIRIRRAQLAALRDRAQRLEIERDQRSRLAAAAERTRVAREMHDIVGHSLSVIISLADGGSYAVGGNPQRGREALELIGDTGRQALAELRRVLGVLREETEAAELHPQPGIAEIGALCERIRAAGPDVVYRTAGDVDALDRGVQLTAYRIAQEALTNALRYAGPRTALDVGLAAGGERLQITVHDTGPQPPEHPPPPAAKPGHGLAGMRERAALYAGTVEAGPRPGGGWTVRATLDLTPLPAPEGRP
ncbi:sensor histidine kinase [Dactylosporangium sp. NPDC048998]|uniref:sensor histidine kinase n=1 Tax=Dactylosporangium sp. NPDC048998 TaxID=3363976 RepID=UPI003717177C